ncbi:hypothetical protein CA234_03090 [Sphingomonas sp. ABOLE]|uniref:phage tail tube protein n=1 Tax=Sphingomonas sp. ABOLE TaxID=1985878 RepID=UPI000F7E0160|nr:phage tail tube protein [Sphingomonas sp. ABOLE]RSV44415.1 hypothetical protein CA234_03090 [Sphingomonas sp. ABOLE]
MAGRAFGANARRAVAFEASYGAIPAPGNAWKKLAFVSSALGEEGGLIEDDLLGLGREPQDPTDDVLNNTGDVVVPVDARAFGYWLMLYFGAPASGNGDPAMGKIIFTAQPAVDSTVSVAGVAFTFKASGAAGNQVNLGADLPATLAALATKLNASADAGVSAATYSSDATSLTVTHDTPNATGNAFALAAGVGSNGTTSGDTLSGGTYAHVFTTGASILPSVSIEDGNPELPSYSTHFGAKGNTMRIQMQRSGQLNATLGLIAQGETAPAAVSGATGAVAVQVARFAQATGSVTDNGQVLATVRTAEVNFSNNLDLDETIRADRRINGADPGKVAVSVRLSLNFVDRDSVNRVGTAFPRALTFGWKNAVGSLTFSLPRVFLPRAKRAINGPGGILAEHNGQASGAQAASMTITLKNDVQSYT